MAGKKAYELPICRVILIEEDILTQSQGDKFFIEDNIFWDD